MNLRPRLPQSLFARLALLLIGAFIVLHAVIYFTVSEYFERQLLKNLLANHSAAIALCVRLIETADASQRGEVVRTLSRLPELSVSLYPQKPDIKQGDDKISLFFLEHLHEALEEISGSDIRQRELVTHVHDANFETKEGKNGSLIQKLLLTVDASRNFNACLVIWLPDGEWLGIQYSGYAHHPYVRSMPFLVMGVEFFVLAALVLLFMHKVVQPLHTLARAAEEFGASPQRSPPLSEDGPGEARRAAQAFNAMRKRIHSIMEERERMFAALSHDLRTPLTRLRLRLETVNPPALREKLLEDAYNLQSIAEIGLAYIESERHTETAVRMDVQAFLEALIEDRRDMGENVILRGEALVSAWLYPVALRRCLENLLDNAARYGGRVSVGVVVRDEGAAGRVLYVDVDDYGPGIAENLLEKVFEPFYRVEASRNPHTGGHGLGLTIAGTMARLHNGTLTLSNRPEGGLRARVRIPLKQVHGS